MTNILVFPCGSEIGLEIYRSFEGVKNIKLFGGSSVDDHGKYVYENYLNKIPFVDEDNFIHRINKIIDQNKIEFIFPAHDSVVLKLAQNQKKIKAKVITSEYKTCKICRSKKNTYRFFKNIINVPETYKTKDLKKISYPIFTKPDVGQGSKGAQLLNSPQEALLLYKNNPSVIFMEYLPGEEYTVDCFTDKKGKLLYAQGRKRNRISNGISVNSSPVFDKRFQTIAKKINKSLKFRGVWFFQLKKNKNKELVLLEIAPRVAGTMSLSRVMGVNLPLLSVYEQQSIDILIQKNDFSVEVDRALYSKYRTNIYYQNIYVDLDDTLIINKKVNSKLIEFLYQSINKNKKIYLITKHKKNITSTLKKYRISKYLFKEIIHLSHEDEKYKFIKNKSIFIDDSFLERIKVFKKTKTPFFSIDSIEMLKN